MLVEFSIWPVPIKYPLGPNPRQKANVYYHTVALLFLSLCLSNSGDINFVLIFVIKICFFCHHKSAFVLSSVLISFIRKYYTGILRGYYTSCLTSLCLFALHCNLLSYKFLKIINSSLFSAELENKAKLVSVVKF